jgi:hypothetical protein
VGAVNPSHFLAFCLNFFLLSLPLSLHWNLPMAKFSPIFFSLLFAISFVQVASNGNGGSEVVNVAGQIIQMKGGGGGGGGGIDAFEKELAAKQTEMKQGIVVNLTLNEIGEIMKFLEETFDNDYFMVLRNGMWEKVLKLWNYVN